MRDRNRYILIFALLILLTGAMLLVSFMTGSAGMTPLEAIRAIGGKGGGVSVDIMRKIRVPRALSALILGGALSLSGYLLQTFFRNPIAGPFVLGVSSSAKLVVAIMMVIAAGSGLMLNSLSMIAAAFFGSMASLGVVLIISRRVKNMAVLVVCGVMIGYICSAVTEFIVTFAADSDIVNLHNWSMGTFSGMRMDNVAVILAVTVPALVCAFLISKPIGAYRLGEEYAKNLGVNIKLLRGIIILLSGLLSATVTAFAGPISFVGIAVPHVIRKLFKTTKPIILIPACFLGGAIFCMVCDMLARSVFAPTEMSISAVTAIFGAPIVILMMIKGRGGEG